jgi:hypothetical protein
LREFPVFEKERIRGGGGLTGHNRGLRGVYISGQKKGGETSKISDAIYFELVKRKVHFSTIILKDFSTLIYFIF